MERRLLIIEDDPGLASQMRWCFEKVQVSVAHDEKEALAAMRRDEPQVVTLDLGLPPDAGGTRIGFALLDRIQALAPGTKVIVVTGRDEREHAVAAVGRGAYDFYHKPIDADTLTFVVDRAFRLAELEVENQRLSAPPEMGPLDGVIASSPIMLDVCRTIERVAPTDATVLILGETGTGKEIMAQALHRLSSRSAGTFVAINCAAIPDTLLESELFGHEKGAFTGAVGQKPGKVETADGGTLFLDEIGDMPLSLQAKMLRFLQERTIERIGGRKPIPVDVRVVSATHQSLDDMIADGRFRHDLYYRISEIAVQLPALSERQSDALLLARAFVRQFAPDRSLVLSRDAQHAIENWQWPGNVRELENRIKRACIMAEGRQISAADLELAEIPPDASTEIPLNLREVREAAERGAVQRALEHANHNLAQAARLLGVSRPTLYNLLSKHDLSSNGGTS